MGDQAATLRRLAGRGGGPVGRPVRVVSVTSGKGGVGKTSIAANMAFQWARRGRRVLLIDGDLGLANLEILLNLQPLCHLGHVLSGHRRMTEVLLRGPAGMSILPASSGVSALTHLTDSQRLHLIEAIDELEDRYDMVVIDTGAGIGPNVTFLTSASQEVVVVATPEPTSITDAYAVMKVLSRDHGIKRFRLLVNAVRESAEGREVYENLSSVAESFLPDVIIRYQGYVFLDPSVGRSVMTRRLLLERFPEAPASRCIARVADDLLEEELAVRPPAGAMGFFWRRLLTQSAAGGM